MAVGAPLLCIFTTLPSELLEGLCSLSSAEESVAKLLRYSRLQFHPLCHNFFNLPNFSNLSNLPNLSNLSKFPSLSSPTPTQP